MCQIWCIFKNKWLIFFLKNETLRSESVKTNYFIIQDFFYSFINSFVKWLLLFLVLNYHNYGIRKYKFSCYLVYPASKSSMTIRHCFRHVNLVSYSLFYISLNISVSLRNLIIFSTSQLFPSSALKSPWFRHIQNKKNPLFEIEYCSFITSCFSYFCIKSYNMSLNKRYKRNTCVDNFSCLLLFAEKA